MSLLTQFYPSGSGNVSIGDTAVTSASSIFILGRNTGSAINVNGGTGVDNIASILPGVQQTWITSIGSGSYRRMIVNNVYLSTYSLPNGGSAPESVILNNGTINAFTGDNSPNITKIEGAGTIGYVRLTTTSSLTSISTDINFTGGGNGQFSITGAALDATTVNHILISLNSNLYGNWSLSKIIDLSGGTSAGTSSLTTEGLAARDALVAAGASVTLNA